MRRSWVPFPQAAPAKWLVGAHFRGQTTLLGNADAGSRGIPRRFLCCLLSRSELRGFPAGRPHVVLVSDGVTSIPGVPAMQIVEPTVTPWLYAGDAGAS